MNKVTTNKRDESIDIFKGLAIILVVYGHTWPFCREFIYLFHMAVFLMASGYFYKYYFKEINDFKIYFFKKLRTLYVPFLISNGLFTVFTNIFIKWNIYTSNPLILSLSESWPVKQKIYDYLDFYGLIKQAITVILFIGPTQLGTATWFLTVLFEILILHSGLEFFIRKMKNKQLVYLLLFFGLLILSQLISLFKPDTYYFFKVLPSCYSAFLLGIWIKKVNWKSLYSWWMGSLSFGILVILSLFYNIELSAGNISIIPVFLIGSLAGWILLKSISNVLVNNKWAKVWLGYVGRHTMPILCLHILAFKIVSEIYIAIYNRPNVLLASFHVIFDANELWKIVYLLFGVIVPLLAYYIYDKTKTKINGVWLLNNNSNKQFETDMKSA